MNAGGRPETRARELQAAVALVSLATTLMLEATRVFVSYLVFVVDQSQRFTIGAIALAVFLSPALAALVIGSRGLARTTWLTVLVIAASRLILQFWDQPVPRIVLAGAVIVCWSWLVIAMLTGRRQAAAIGLVTGLGLDVAVRIAFRTIDLPWMPGAAAHVVTTVFVAGLIVTLATLGLLGRPSEPNALAAMPVLVIGPGLAFFHLLGGNPGLSQVRTGLAYPEAMLALAGGVGLGLALAARQPATSRLRAGIPTLLDVAAGSAGLWLFWNDFRLSWIGLIVTVAAGFDLLARALDIEPARRGGAGWTTLWLTAGMAVQFAILFIYYSTSGSVLLLIVAWITLAAAGAIGTARPVQSAARCTLRPRSAAVPVGVGALALAVAAGWTWVTWSPADPTPRAGDELTVMSYNIQNGFSADNEWDLDATARTIEAADPDVVVLQEVGRGWLVMGGADQLVWLSGRLNMEMAWGPASGDGLWGNAILSRIPISEQRVVRYDATQNLARSAISVGLDTGDGEIGVVGTHLDNPAEADAVRSRQVIQLLEFWNERTPALILGDFNALPDDPIIGRLTGAGLVDLGLSLGPEAYTSADRRRIDYIFATPDLNVLDIAIPQSRASDHRPVVATLRVE